MDIYKKFSFDSAHYLPNLPEDHKCKRMHGHTFNVEIHITGNVNQEIGWIMDFSEIKTICDPVIEQLDHRVLIMDFSEIKTICDPVIEQLDHRVLNDIKGLDNPTSENLAKWIWEKVKPQLSGLKKIIVSETCSTGCIYKGQ